MSRTELRAGRELERTAMSELRRICQLSHCSWGPRVGDRETLAAFPVFIGARAWSELCALSQSLAEELAAGETELLERPELHGLLGMPGALRRLFARSPGHTQTPSFARTLRIDFHPTPDGWRVSEVNSDVPGGFSEAESFTSLMAAQFPESSTPGAPASRWADLVRDALPGTGRVALLSAPGHVEDFQVTAYLGQRLEERGIETSLVSLAQLTWREGRAFLVGGEDPLSGIVRFYQAEWLGRLHQDTGWRPFFFGGRTLVSNAPRAALSESKRFPLLWSQLSSRFPTFSRLLPETRAPQDAPWLRDDGWLLKASYGNTGDSVVARAWVDAARWRSTAAQVLLRPGAWLAQRRFETVRIDTPAGLLAPCVGVYVIDGQVAGAYLRLTKGHWIDYSALDAALLISNEA